VSLTPFVYVDTPLEGVMPGTALTVSDDTWKHVRTVLRLKPGMPVVASDGLGVTVDAAVAASDNMFIVTGEWHTHQAETPALTLVQAVPKLRKLDTVVRLASEVGVDTVLPVVTTRSHAGLRDVGQDKLSARLRAIATAAGEQARRPYRLTLATPVLFATLCDMLDGTPAVLLDGDGDGFAAVMERVTTQADGVSRIALVVGPEGGFTEEERTQARACGVHVARLGASVLRTEHAGLAAAVLLGRFDA